MTIVDPSKKNLIFGSIAAAVLGVLLVVMLIVACRNRDRMKEVVKNFLELEIRTAAELLLDVWDIYGAPVPSLWVILGRLVPNFDRLGAQARRSVASGRIDCRRLVHVLHNARYEAYWLGPEPICPLDHFLRASSRGLGLLDPIQAPLLRRQDAL